MTFDYDDGADVLYVTFEEYQGRPSYVENNEGDILRLDPATGKILGCTILFFLKRAALGPISIPEIGVVPFNQIAHRLLEERKHGTKEH